MDFEPPKNKISFLIYENKKSPKYFEISRGLLKLLFIGLPTITVISLALLILGVLSIKQVMLLGKSTTPRIINELRAERAELLRKQNSLSLKVDRLEETRQQAKETPKILVTKYGFFKTPGIIKESTINSTLFLLENVQITPTQNKVYLKFNLVNNTPQKNRLEGYLFITMKARNSIHFYPAYSLSSDDLEINYNRGESFSTSRFRPVITDFPFDGKPSRLLFHVYTFSKEGDLTFVKSFLYNVKNYQLGTTINLIPNKEEGQDSDPDEIETEQIPQITPLPQKEPVKIIPTATPKIEPTATPINNEKEP